MIIKLSCIKIIYTLSISNLNCMCMKGKVQNENCVRLVEIKEIR